jgi:hypothetical protein
MAGFGVVIETYHVSPVRNPSFMQQRHNTGKIYIAGETDKALFSSSLGRSDAWVAHYDSNGNQIGAAQLGTIQDDAVYGIAVDPTGKVYLSGQTYGDFGSANAGKYDAWVAQYALLSTV